MLFLTPFLLLGAALAAPAESSALANITTASALVAGPHGLTPSNEAYNISKPHARRDVIITYFYTGLIGGNGGSYYEDHFRENTGGQHNPNWGLGTKGLVKRINVWWQNDWQGLHGIQVTYMDGTIGPMHGKPDGNRAQLDLVPGEKITELRIWGNGQGTRAGRIKIMTNKRQSPFEYGKDNAGNGYDQDISGTSGILTGIFGRSGDALDCLGFTFIMPISNQRTTNLQFNDNVVGTTAGITDVRLNSWYFENNTPTTQTYRSDCSTYTTSSTRGWSNQISLELGISFSIKAGVPDIAEQTTSVSWKLTDSYTSSASTTTTVSTSVCGSCEVPARSTCTDDALVTKGELPSLTYSADVQINVNGWDGWKFRETGTFNTVAYTKTRHVTSIKSN